MRAQLQLRWMVRELLFCMATQLPVDPLVSYVPNKVNIIGNILGLHIKYQHHSYLNLVEFVFRSEYFLVGYSTLAMIRQR